MSTYFSPGLPTDPPVLDPETRPYWAAAERGTLVVPFCTACEQHFWYPRGFCPRCAGDAIEWPQVSGHGEIYSYSVVRRGFGAWAEHTPFVIAWVTLDIGVTVLTNVVCCTEEQLSVNLPVTALFEAAGDGPPALRFVSRTTF